MYNHDDFSDWVNRRFDDLAVEFVDDNEDKFNDFAWKKFEKFLENQGDYNEQEER